MHNEMNGIVKCKMFREIRRQICINNGIPFLEDECPTPDKRCIGTCPICDYWLDRLNALLEIKRLEGEIIDYSGIKEIFNSYKNDSKSK